MGRDRNQRPRPTNPGCQTVTMHGNFSGEGRVSIFGWGKQHGTMRKTKHRGIARVAADFLLNLIAYNLIRIPKLLAA